MGVVSIFTATTYHRYNVTCCFYNDTHNFYNVTWIFDENRTCCHEH